MARQSTSARRSNFQVSNLFTDQAADLTRTVLVVTGVLLFSLSLLLLLAFLVPSAIGPVRAETACGRQLPVVQRLGDC